MLKIHQALEQIKANGLNRFRCCLTGAPYAEISDEEIVIDLESMLDENAAYSVDRLVDMWELKSITFNSQRAPILRGVHKNSLMPLLWRGKNGNSRIVVYMMTRLLFPQIGSDFVSYEESRDRAQFAAQLYDLMQDVDFDSVATMAQELAAIDAYCSMPLWHTLWAFESPFAQYGIHKAPAYIKALFSEPLSLFDATNQMARVADVIQYMFKLMLHVAERDGVAGKSGSILAQRILVVQAQNAPVNVVPAFQKKVTPEQRQTIQHQRAVNTRTELKMAWSATHGKGHLPNDSSKVQARLAEKALRETLKNNKKEKKADRKVKAKAESKTKGKYDDLFASVIKSAVLLKFGE